MKKITICAYTRFATSEQLNGKRIALPEKLTRQNIYQYMRKTRSVKVK